MMIQPQLDFLVDTASNIFGKEYPLYPNVTLPKPSTPLLDSPLPHLEIRALWTKDGLRPRWGNLAAAAHFLSESTGENLDWWRFFVDHLKIPLAVLSSNNHYYVINRFSSGQLEVYNITRDRLSQELERQRRELFSPQSLSRLRSGQMSFADLEETLSEGTFAYHLRYQAQLNQALTNALQAAIEAQFGSDISTLRLFIDWNEQSEESIVNSVITVAVAYLAARILEDKGFFDNQRLLLDDPKELLKKTLERKDGFFNQAYYKHLPRLEITTLQALAAHIGNSVTFALIDHQEIGRLYEQAVQVTENLLKPYRSQVTRPELLDLQQHYTPQAIADRMLDLLPLERLRPEERVIFDPAAGSGSLLLAATRRLARMPDVVILPERENYLTRHVVGNDFDPNARLITKLRYSLVQEAFGQQELFPDPVYFGGIDYNYPKAWEVPLKPRVIVANPPFAEDKEIQRAARFVQLVSEYLKDNDQFAIVLPQTFLTGSTHGWPEARRSLSKRCHIFEVWQLPEGVIGLSAQLPVCIVLGVAGKRHTRGTIARAIVSRAQVNTIRNEGFLGPAWITEIESEAIDWRAAIAPVLKISIPTIPLGHLFEICTGVGLKRDIPPTSDAPSGTKVKFYWSNKWRERDALWANPERVPPEQRYIQFGEEFLEGHRSSKEEIYDAKKIMVGRITNRGARYPLAVCLDTFGFCPNKNIFCIVPLAVEKQELTPEGWADLDYMSQLLWLLGILSSSIAVDQTISVRNARHLTKENLENFPLPLEIDHKIIELTNAIVQGEKEYRPRSELASLREELDKTVEISYGNPERKSVSLTRTGSLPDLRLWQAERKHPSFTVTGQVLNFDPNDNRVYLYLDGLLEEEQEAWVPLPPELPGWALDGTVFEAELSRSVETFNDLIKHPWALRNFKHTPRPYLTLEELQKRLLSGLGIES